MSSNDTVWHLWIDTGGTFTDCLAIDPSGNWHRCKVLSHGALRGKVEEVISPARLRINQSWEAPDQFISDFEFQLLDHAHPFNKVAEFDSENSVIELKEPLNFRDRDIERQSFEVRYNLEAPTLAAHLVTGIHCTGFLPEMRMRLATTKGTNALLEGKGASTALFLTEGYRNLLDIGNQQRTDLFALHVERADPLYQSVVEVEGRLDAEGNVLKEIDFNRIEERVDQLLKNGINTAAIGLMHSYKNPDHELKLARWLLEKGFKHVSSSTKVSPFIKILPRTETALVDAYLTPVINDYLQHVEEHTKEGSLYVMTSAGGLENVSSFQPKDSLLSGPAGGVVGASAVGRQCGFDRVVSFDMGGTSTDVSRYDGEFDYVFEHTVGDTRLMAPALSIETVAAGGGSICSFDGRALTLGPESAGADPGPACYGAGGPLTLTDINLLLGRLDPANFGIPVDLKAAQNQFRKLFQNLQKQSAERPTRTSVLQSFLDIANERMANTIRKISVRKGYDLQNYALVGFGGAGGQHACSIARRLGINNVLIPPDAGLLSAYGLGQAVLEKFTEKQILSPLGTVQEKIGAIFSELEEKAFQQLKKEGIEREQTEVRRRLVFMRLERQDSTLEIEYEGQRLDRAFREKYENRYGHWLADRSIEVESIRVVAGSRSTSESPSPANESTEPFNPPVQFVKTVEFAKGSLETPAYNRNDLSPGAFVVGPALVLDTYSTLVIPPDWQATALDAGHLRLTRKSTDAKEKSNSAFQIQQPEAAKVELFTNRLGTIAEEMGEMLQRTALSVNVKERLDFSCAILDADGKLVVNAPHIPVHLGALGLCVRRVSEAVKWKPGDAVVTNHPDYGGSHLPDITVITPIFYKGEQLTGFAASRAHHAEIGGTRPGSMPPRAQSLAEEGVVIPPMHILRSGEGRWEKIRHHLNSGEYPTRSVDENIADLRAAVAANQRGRVLMKKLIDQEGFKTTHHYMGRIRERAFHKMKTTLASLENGTFKTTEYLDDKTPLHAEITIKDDSMEIDFTGSGEQHPGNLNATPAIVYSAITYILRLLIDEPLPLNEGLLSPITITLPKSLLNPQFQDDSHHSPAVVGGNTETSQRLVDTLLRPLNLMACSQGTMNNILFGNEKFGYYETIGGGTGGGPGFNGADAVHHHMTNTRATDPEILEYRYPIRLIKYAIRTGSGGRGQFDGGNGIVRRYLFLERVELSVLTQHRTTVPYGLKGGQPGIPGEQYILRKSGERVELKSIDGTMVETGDQLIVKTPGGGGYGKPAE